MAISDGEVRVWEDLALPDLSDPRLVGGDKLLHDHRGTTGIRLPVARG